MADWHPSPNFGPRPDGVRPDTVVLHYTAMANYDAALARLTDGEGTPPVSAHYLIGRSGAVAQLVAEDKRAWHAGIGSWGGDGDVNSRSIGIELDNCGTSPFAAPLMDALEALLAVIFARWQIAPARVIGHSDCAPGRKVDPGPRFDWARLARGGWAAPTPEGEAAGDFVQAMGAAGYTWSEDPETLLAALRWRHRPWASGPPDARDIGIAQGLAGQAAVDRSPALA